MWAIVRYRLNKLHADGDYIGECVSQLHCENQCKAKFVSYKWPRWTVPGSGAYQALCQFGGVKDD
jgi:hypothetical protein